jgi:hypothetical protein
LPENKQNEEWDEYAVLEIGIAVGADPLENQAGEILGIKPGDEQQQGQSLPTGQVEWQTALPRRQERNCTG